MLGMTHLGDVVIGIPFQLNGDSSAQPGSQRLPSMSSQLDVDCVCRQASFAKPLYYLMTEGGACGPVGVEDRHFQIDGLGLLGLGVVWQGRGALRDELDVKPSLQAVILTAQHVTVKDCGCTAVMEQHSMDASQGRQHVLQRECSVIKQ